jgi:predicted TIM-barrel fold metal-dependent hydrolase
MNVDCDSHFTPPEVYEDSEVKKYYAFDMNGFKPSEIHSYKLGVYGRDFKKRGIPFVRDIYGNEMPFDPTNFGIDIRLNAMKEAGFDKQCLIPFYNRLTAPPYAEKVFVRARNDAVAKFCDKNKQFIPIGDLPHKDPNSAIEEAERCVKDLGFPAVSMEGAWLATYEGTENPESLDWWPFYELISKLDVPIFFHPRGEGKSSIWIDQALPATDRLGLFPGKLGDMFGIIMQAQIGIFGLIYSGILDKYPNLKFMMLECDAGWVPGYMSTLDGIYQTHRINVENAIDYRPLVTAQIKDPTNLKKKPSQYFRDNFLFCLMYPGPLQLDAVLPVMVGDEVGLRKNLVIGSDWPHIEGTLDMVRLVMQNKDIDREARLDICGRNAERILKLEHAPSAYAEAYVKE